MIKDFSRRHFLGVACGSAVSVGLAAQVSSELQAASTRDFRIRTITAGIRIGHPSNLGKITEAGKFLKKMETRYTDLGYEVQTRRIATEAFSEYAPYWKEKSSLKFIQEMDALAGEQDVVFNIGPIITGDSYEADRAKWAVDVIQSTNRINFTTHITSDKRGIHYQTIRTSAEIIRALAGAKPGGEGNFNFSATAFVPAGSPFFPAAYHEGEDSFAIGLETPRLLDNVFKNGDGMPEAGSRLKARMESEFGAVEKTALEMAAQSGWLYGGIDSSPAPGPDSSIGRAIETLTGRPFGSASTLQACAIITDVLKNLSVKTCGYSGLMLPVIEDEILAKRAAEGRYGVSELLLYSSVCGTGLDVVPLPGDISVDAIARILGDVAALSNKYHKALSARLFPIPGKAAGDSIQFDHPFLQDSVVMSPE